MGNLHIQTTDRRQTREKPAWTQSQHVNDCDDCDAKCCTSRKQATTKAERAKACLCKNAKLPLPTDATYGEKQYVSLNRAYYQLHPTADLCKTTIEQMRAVVRKAKKDKPAVLPVDKQPSGTQPDLSQDQMRMFAAWLKESNGGEQVTVLTTGADPVIEIDPARVAEGLSMLTPCLFCFVLHTPQNPWCALSMGMPGVCPSLDTSAGCTRSQCETRCSSDMRAYN